MKKTAIVVMAAGKGVRFYSKYSKLIHNLAGQEMIKYLANTIKEINPKQSIFVVSYQKEEIKSILKDFKIDFVEQKVLNGTAGALKEALKCMNKNIEKVIILPGDTPMIPKELLLEISKKCNAVVGVKTKNPNGYGRLLIKNGKLLEIIEDKDLTEKQKEIDIVNSSIYCLDRTFLEKNISKIKENKNKKEYYLTDIIKIASDKKIEVDCCVEEDEIFLLGPNDKYSFSILEKEVYFKRARKIAQNGGVNIKDLYSLYIDESVKIGRDSTIYPNVFITKESIIEEDVVVLEGTRIVNSHIGKGSVVGPYAVIDNCEIGPNNKVGPFIYVRPETKTKDNVKLGSFVEIKKSSVDKNTKIPHLSYVGDAEVGKDVNIGCGVITCNYDGVKKNKTIIKDRAFIGSDSQLVAPVKIEEDAYIAAGTTVTKDVGKGSLAISRIKQTEIKNYNKRKK